MPTTAKIHTGPTLTAVQNFDRLPKKAQVSAEVFCLLKCVSRTTFWRMQKRGAIPQPACGGARPRWYVEDVRKHLAGAGAA